MIKSLFRRSTGIKQKSADCIRRAAIETLEDRRHLSMNVYLYGSYQEQGTEGSTIAFGVTAYDSNYWEVPDGVQHPPVTVGYSVGGAGAGDIESPPGTVEVTWEEGGPYGFGVIILPIRRDNDVEGDEQITVSITGGGDYQIGFPSWFPDPDPSPGSQTGVIHDDPPIVAIAALDADGTENASGEDADPVSFKVTRSGGDPTQPIDVHYSLSGTASSGQDYENPGSSVSVLTEGTQVIHIKDDPDAEGVETIVATLTEGANYLLAPPGTQPATAPATTMRVDDNASVSDIKVAVMSVAEVAAVPNKNLNMVTNYGSSFTFSVKVTITGEHLDHVQIRQLVDTDDDKYSPIDGHKYTREEMVSRADKPEAKRLMDTDGYVVDEKWNWETLVPETAQNPADANKTAILYDNQSESQLEDWNTYAPNKVTDLFKTTRKFRLQTKKLNDATDTILLSKDWSYSYSNLNLKWTAPGGNPFCALVGQGRKGIFSDADMDNKNLLYATNGSVP